jgi:acyl-coenzyme A thioesterase PaaI-like protein
MDYETVREGLQAAIPYNNHVGLEYVEVGDGTGVVRLPDADRLKNHVGSQHAAALFSAGEAASGGAFVGAFAQHLAGVTPLARSAEISYLKLAKGEITATGTLRAAVDELLATLDSEGRVEFPVDVEMTDGDGNTVAEMTVRWHVRRNA